MSAVREHDNISQMIEPALRALTKKKKKKKKKKKVFC